MVICVSEINVMFHVVILFLVQSENVATIIFVPRFATQIITVYREKFAMSEVFVKLDAQLNQIVHRLKFVSTNNVNAAKDLLAHHSDALILMNVQKIHVTRVHYVKIHLDHLDVFVQIKLLVMHMQLLDVYYQINAHETKIALLI